MSMNRARQCLLNQKTFRDLNAFIHLPEDAAILKAVSEAKDESGHQSRPSCLSGELIAVKDNICTLQQPTTCASSILKGFISPYAATVVERLQAVGAVITGKTNLDEFGMGSHSTHTMFGPVFQELQDDRVSVGGSSGGSAIAVATGQCWAALGTDTGGSVRLPAAYTGIFGFKPSYGVISRHGVVAYANSLDTVGIMSKELSTIEQIFSLVRDHDPQDPTNLSVKSRGRISQFFSTRDEKRPKRTKLSIGVPIEYNLAELDSPIKIVWEKVLIALASAGHSVIPVSLPATEISLPAYYILATAEASSNLAKYDAVRYGNPAPVPKTPENVLFATSRGYGLGEEVRRRILLGSFSLSAFAIDNYFLQAQRVRRLIQRDFDRVFAVKNPLFTSRAVSDCNAESEGVDILLSPTAPSLPPRLKSLSTRTPIKSYRDDVLTVPASLAGLPAMSIPATKMKPAYTDDNDQHKQIGLQITAQYGDDQMIFHAAELLQNLEAGKG